MNEMQLRGKLGGLTTASRHDPREYSAAGRAAFEGKFLAEQPTDLPEAERVRRAAVARALHYTRIALLSVQARKRKARKQ